jgi:hypothetical protein
VIRWPSGIVQTVLGVDANQRLTIVEPGPTRVGDGPEPVLELQAPVPNPFGRETSLRFSLPAAAHVRLAIHDLQGRRVATLVDGTRDAGWYSVRWGRSAGGEPPGAGIYWARLETMGASRTRKLVAMP